MTLNVRAARRHSTLTGACWGGAAIIVALVRNHAWATPNISAFSSAASHLGSNPIPGKGDYILTNWLPMLVQRGLGQTRPHEIVRLSLLIWAVSMVTISVWVARAFGTRAAACVAVLLALAPVSTTTLEWLGQPDPFTILAAAALVLARRRCVVVAWGAVLGMTHPEQGVLIVLAAAIAWSVVESAPVTWKTCANRAVLGTAGLLLGRGALEIYFRVNNIALSGSRWSVFTDTIGELAAHHRIAPGWMLYAMFGPLWLLIGVHHARASRSHALDRSRWRWLLLGVALGLLGMLLTFDQTRVFSLVTVPVVIAMAIQISREVQWDYRELAVVALIGAALPGVFTAGKVYGAKDLPISEFVDFVKDGRVPGGSVDAWAFKPFPFKIPGT